MLWVRVAQAAHRPALPAANTAGPRSPALTGPVLPAPSEQDSGGPLPGQAYGNPHLRAVFSPCSMQRAPRPSESLGPGPQRGLSGALVRSARA